MDNTFTNRLITSEISESSEVFTGDLASWRKYCRGQVGFICMIIDRGDDKISFTISPHYFGFSGGDHLGVGTGGAN